MTTRVEFTQEGIDELYNERYSHPDPKVQRKMEAVYLKSCGLQHKEIQKICRISSNTTMKKYLDIYNEDGIEGLKKQNYKGQPSELGKHSESLEELFEANPPKRTGEAQAMIEEKTGIRRSPTQVREYMKRIGMGYRKVGFVPGKSDDPEKQKEQEEFRTEQLEPLLEEAKEGNRVVLFMDAAHFVWTVYLGYLWCFARQFIRSPTGRKRFNVLGAVDAISKEIHTFTNESYINSTSVCTFLRQISKHYGKGVPITIVLDNASYQRCKLVQNLAAELGIHLLFLPSYSPHLNLIERLWRFTKKECLYSEHYSSFDEFRLAISSFLDEAPTKHKSELDSLLALNFQSFDKVHFLPA